MHNRVHFKGLSLCRPVRILLAIGLLLISACLVQGQCTQLIAQSAIKPGIRPQIEAASHITSAHLTESRSTAGVIFTQTLPWGIETLVPLSVRSNNRGSAVKIAILDTGIDSDHPDLKVASSVSFVAGTTAADDDNGHGTMLAGIIAALDNNIGVVGVASEAEIYSVKVISADGKGDTEAVVKGLEWCIANKMQIINLSFGDPNQLPLEVLNALQKAYEEGITIIAGAGNSGQTGNPDAIFYPAKYNMVISVGSVDELAKRAVFSSTGPRLDLMAPGSNIISCNNQGTYSSSSGTSYSAAYVSGVAALLISAGVSDNQKIKEILENSAQDLGSPGWDTQYGYGLIHAGRAISLISANPSP